MSAIFSSNPHIHSLSLHSIDAVLETVKNFVHLNHEVPNDVTLKYHDVPTADGKLYMFKYPFKEGSDPENFENEGELRGTIVFKHNSDSSKDRIVCHTYKQSILAEVNELNALTTFKDKDENTYSLELSNDNYRVTRGFDGVCLRIFMFDNEVFVSSHSSIDIEKYKSRLGTEGPLFFDLFQNLYMKTRSLRSSDAESKEEPANFREILKQDLFSERNDLIYLFMLSPATGEVLTYSKQPDDLLVFLEACVQNGAFSEPVNELPSTFTKLLSDNLTDCYGSLFIYRQQVINLDVANQFLLYGHNQPHEVVDSRVATGEFVLVSDKRDNLIYRLQSTGYVFRMNMRENTPNVVARMYKLLDTGKMYRNNVHGFRVEYPCFEIPNLKNLLASKNNYLTEAKYILDEHLYHDNTKRDHVFMGLLHSCPKKQWELLVSEYEGVNDVRKSVANWIYELWIDNAFFGKLIEKFTQMKKANQFDAVYRIMNKALADSSRVPLKARAQAVKNNMQLLLQNEYGKSLYQLKNLRQKCKSMVF